METGQRGYVITGDSDFLEPFNTAKWYLKPATDSLRNLLSDNEDQINFYLKKSLFRSIINPGILKTA